MTLFPETALQSESALEAIRIIRILSDAGFQAVLAGGCVRDVLLGRTPKDFDVATNATPDSVRQVFGKRHTLAFGASFGVIGVLPPKTKSKSNPNAISNGDAKPTGAEKTGGNEKRVPTEVATFRADGDYSDGRRPDTVTFGTAEADALRRDFTINGMFYDPTRQEVLDYVGGLDDLQSRHLRTIGDPSRRFDEDKLRMLRAVRFVTTLDLSIEPATLVAVTQYADSIGIVSGERIGAEIRRILVQDGGDRGLQLLVETGLHRRVWTMLERMPWPLLRTRYERDSVRTFEVRLALALLTLHKSVREATDHLVRIASDWKLSVAEQRATKMAIQSCHDLIHCGSVSWSKLQPLLIDRDIVTALAVAEAVTPEAEEEGVARVRHELKRADRPLNPQPLLTGNDLIESGFSAGPQFKTWLSVLRQKQLDGELTTKEEALQWVRSHLIGS